MDWTYWTYWTYWTSEIWDDLSSWLS
jgi:hypothetical protein